MLSLQTFNTLFPSDNACLETLTKLRFPHGIYCDLCKRITKHYKLTKRPVYECKFCRRHVSPLKGTLFEKTTTPLLTWFYAMFLMTHTKADMHVKDLQRELHVTYKTAWRMYTLIRKLMAQNKGDLLYADAKEVNSIKRWTLFNAFEFKVTEKKDESD